MKNTPEIGRVSNLWGAVRRVGFFCSSRKSEFSSCLSSESIVEEQRRVDAIPVCHTNNIRTRRKRDVAIAATAIGETVR
jgi:hypothetical protein